MISPAEARWSAFAIVYDQLTMFPSILPLMASNFHHKTRLQLTCFSHTLTSSLK